MKEVVSSYFCQRFRRELASSDTARRLVLNLDLAALGSQGGTVRQQELGDYIFYSIYSMSGQIKKAEKKIVIS